MENGDIVTIYRYPMLQNEIEGKAKLLNYIGIDGYYNKKVLQLWQVNFIGDDPTEKYYRTILI